VVPAAHEEVVAPSHEVPIALDTVLRLAEEQNAQIALARERVNESLTENQIAASGWLPRVYAGVAYYRHEGGIQNEDGTLTHSSTGALFPGVEIHGELDVREAAFQRVNAERKVWQSKGELSRVTNETLLEAANTYIDLLTARRGEALGVELEKFQLRLLGKVEKLITPDDRSALVMVESIRAEISARRQAIARLHQQGDAASAKLAYLLGLGPDAELVPVEQALTPIDVVDVSPPTSELVARALSQGPGVRELEGLLSLIQSGLAQLNSPLRFLPTVQLNMIEGGFGAGAGARLDWDNRWDLGLQARYNLTEWLTARERKKLAYNKMHQAQLSYQDLRGKLTAGVQEAREAVVGGRDQIRFGAEQIRHASETYRLSDLRWEQRAAGSTPGEVQQSIRGLEAAHFGYLLAVAAYDKAQIRLLLLLGPSACAPGH
jgi:outer membrane protein TolC